MKFILTTSNNYLHIIPIFCYLFNKNWSDKQEVEIVGYNEPKNLPNNFKFVSLGEQIGGPENFSNDLAIYFAKQDKFFIWAMDDTFIKNVDFEKLEIVKTFINFTNVGRINLCSRACMIQEHIESSYTGKYKIYENTQTAKYRLCTQISIWNKDFLLKYLTPNLTPWKFENQNPTNDDFRIFGIDEEVVIHNEGVCKHNIYDYDLHGISEEQLNEMKQLQII